MNPRAENRKRRWVRPARIITYCFLALLLSDYFFFHPAKVHLDQLQPAKSGYRSLTERLKQQVYYMASPRLEGRAPGTPANKEVEQHILKQFKSMGLSPGPFGTRTQQISPAIGNNIFSAQKPIHPDRDWIIIGAHFDHLGKQGGKVYLGADDNASGVATLIETARLLKLIEMVKYNVLFVAFNAEEAPYFLTQMMGSHHFYHHIREIGIAPEKIKLAVIMDLMGGVLWEPIKDTLFVMGAEKSPELEKLVPTPLVKDMQVNRLGIHMIESIPYTGNMIFSDYQVFREHNIPYLFLSAGRTPDYHRPSDTAEKLHYVRMAKTVFWLIDLIRNVDFFEGNLTYDRERENFVQDYEAMAPMIRAASQWWTKIPQTGLITLYKLKDDFERYEKIKEKIDAGKLLTKRDGELLSRASIRLQCLMGNMGPCFLLPSGDPS